MQQKIRELIISCRCWTNWFLWSLSSCYCLLRSLSSHCCRSLLLLLCSFLLCSFPLLVAIRVQNGVHTHPRNVTSPPWTRLHIPAGIRPDFAFLRFHHPFTTALQMTEIAAFRSQNLMSTPQPHNSLGDGKGDKGVNLNLFVLILILLKRSRHQEMRTRMSRGRRKMRTERRRWRQTLLLMMLWVPLPQHMKLLLQWFVSPNQSTGG